MRRRAASFAGAQGLFMKAWLRLLKARILLLCSVGVVLLGLVPVLYLLGLAAWQFDLWSQTGLAAPVLASIPRFYRPWAPDVVLVQGLSILHVGGIAGLIGCAVMAVGISSALRQRVLIRIHKERRKEARQRLQAGYERRVEPFIGTADVA
jgi:hypothetical protein